MKKALFLLILLCSSVAYSHEYFFAFAEVEINEMTGTIEATISVTAHDFEQHLKKNGLISTDLRSCQNDSLKMEILEKEINQHFQIDSEQENSIMDGAELIYFHLEGMEISLNGTVQLYLSANFSSVLKELNIRFDLLMDEYSEQQNKLTLICRGKKNTYAFLQTTPKQKLEL